jgi:hypothetical protein
MSAAVTANLSWIETVTEKSKASRLPLADGCRILAPFAAHPAKLR